MVSIPSTGDRVSRWTPLIFACALANFILAQLLIIAGVSWPAASDASGSTLAAVHLLTIGWLTLLMFGALFQFVPVLTSHRLRSHKLSLGALLLTELGLAGMVCGFFLLGTQRELLLPLGGGAVILGILAGGLNLAIPLARKRPRPLSAHFVIAGLILLLLTVILGLCFALAFTTSALALTVGPVVASGVEYHVLAGIGGWFTLTAIGVSYELLPMFMLAPHGRGAWGKAVLWMAVSGFTAALGAGVLAPAFPYVFVAGIEQAGRVIIAMAVVLYLADIARMYRDRRRRQIELHNRAAVGAFASLAAALATAVIAGALNTLDRVAPALVFLLIFGWLSGLGLSQLYKIVPFLAWLARFGSRLGTGPVPRVQDLVDERAGTYMFVAYFVSVAAASIAALLDISWLVRAAMVAALGATVLLSREFWRAWQGYYVQRLAAAQTPISIPSRTKGAGHDARATHA